MSNSSPHAVADVSADVLSSLRRIIRYMDMHSRKLSKVLGLTTPQLIIILEIGQSGRMTIGELARRVSLSQATVTTILDRLEAKQLASRDRDLRDKRRVYVDISPRAKEIIAANPNALQTDFVKRFNGLADWERTLILSSIQRVGEMMKPASPIDEDEFIENGSHA